MMTRTALDNARLLFVWAGAILLVALIGWWLSEHSPRDEDEPLNATYTGELINQLIATVNRVFRRKRLL